MLLLPTSALAASTTRFNQGATGFFARDRTVGNVSAIDHDCTNDCSCAVGGGGLAGRLLLPRVALRRR